MANSPLELPDSERAALRAAVTVVDQQISALALSEQPSLDAYRVANEKLVVSWAALVKLLALGEAPELRECSRCKHLGMRAATRCGYCWMALPAL